jgi:predicted phosphodiesterase
VRLAIYSDLHLEFAPFDPPALDVDVIVLAGDIGPKLTGIKFANSLRSRSRAEIVYVPGNHEFYGSNTRLVDKLREHANAGVHVLDNNSVCIDRVRFLGATLWTDFSLYRDTDEVAAKTAAGSMMNDYECIRNAERSYQRLTPTDTQNFHAQSCSWINDQLSCPLTGRVVVVTHHAPSEHSLAPKHRGSPLSPAFASSLEWLVMGSRANLWIYGHTHYNADYRIGLTRVLSNQRGYPDEDVEGFDPALVVEI